MKRTAVILLLSVLSLTAVVLSLCAGQGDAAFSAVKDLLNGNQTPDAAVLLYMRIPRVCTAFVVGSSLAVSGALFQSMVKNALADPYTLGVSGGASLGAAAAIILALPYPAVALIALAGAAGAALLVYTLARSLSAGENSVILSGIGINILASSAVMLMFALAESHRVHKALLWLMGDLSLARYESLIPTAAAAAVLILAALRYAPHLNLLSYGSDYAHAAGVSKTDLRVLFAIGSFLAALSVSLAGVVGFVGLIAPHLVRRLVGTHDNRIIIPLSCVCGGGFLALCDTIGRLAAYPYELPCGVITGFAGGVMLVVILSLKKE
jgi:iron complex transport system permease protein